MTPPTPKELAFVTRPVGVYRVKHGCKFFKAGACKYGHKCRNAHIQFVFENLPNGSRVTHVDEDVRNTMPAAFTALSVVEHLKSLGIEGYENFEEAKSGCYQVCGTLQLDPSAAIEAAMMMCTRFSADASAVI